MWSWWWLWVLPLAAQVPVGPLESPCGSDQYELHGLCCNSCPAGFYVSRFCDVDRVTKCSPCEPGSYMAHRNRETQCLPCTECRDGDQELVSGCTRDSNRRCQCKTGSYYCDSEDCVEACHRCSRCDGPTLETCNATRDTICAPKGNPEPGDPPRSRADSSHIWAVVVTVILAIVAIIAISVAVIWCRRRGAQLSHLVVHCLKREPRDSGGPSQGGPQPGVNLMPEDPGRSLPATDAESAPLLEQPGTLVAPSEDPEARVQPQEAVPTESGASLEQAPQAQAPAAPGGSDQTEAAAPLHALEQQYEQKYVLKDGSPEAMNRIYFEFGQQVPQRSWRMFMRFSGLEENDIVICEHENPGNLAEQHHGMLLCWQSKLGRAASPCRLMAALHKMGLRECLENVINKLVAEDILSSKDAEPLK